MKSENLYFIKAQIHDIKEIHFVLLKAFEPYKINYTIDAFNATVLPQSEIKNRILGKKYEIYVLEKNKKIIGTVSFYIKNKNQIHIRSMAVHPNNQKKGVGSFILKEIEEMAKEKNIKSISLDTSKPLKIAIKFYKKFGFRFTGVKHNFYGIEIYEMIKTI